MDVLPRSEVSPALAFTPGSITGYAQKAPLMGLRSIKSIGENLIEPHTIQAPPVCDLTDRVITD